MIDYIKTQVEMKLPLYKIQKLPIYIIFIIIIIYVIFQN